MCFLGITLYKSNIVSYLEDLSKNCSWLHRGRGLPSLAWYSGWLHQAHVAVCKHSLHVCLLTQGFCPKSTCPAPRVSRSGYCACIYGMKSKKNFDVVGNMVWFDFTCVTSFYTGSFYFRAWAVTRAGLDERRGSRISTDLSGYIFSYLMPGCEIHIFRSEMIYIYLIFV